MDWKKLTTDTKQSFSKFQKETPATFEGFGIMGKDAKKDGHLSEKTKEFIALGISIAVREMIPSRKPELDDIKVYQKLHEVGTKVQHICYEPEDLDLLSDVLKLSLIHI